MEESVNLSGLIKQSFALEEVDIRTYSPLTLAYVGDSVFDLIVKTLLVGEGNEPVNKLNRKATSYVKAPAQAIMAEEILPVLTEEELAVYKRGRNAKSYTSAKNASVGDYRKATGLEALIGYLYLEGKIDRVLTLVKLGIEKLPDGR